MSDEKTMDTGSGRGSGQDDGWDGVRETIGELDDKRAGTYQADAMVDEAGSLNWAKAYGRYLIAGHYGDAGTVPLNPHLINKKQVMITGVWSAANRHFLKALTLLQKVNVEKLVTHRFGLTEVNEALIAAEQQHALKAVIVP